MSESCHMHRRILSEYSTVKVMIGMYCHDHHDHTASGLCPSCEALREYAYQRLRHCPFQEHKAVCSKCPVHCYKPQMREQIKAVMRYAGPRMLYRHPGRALAHLFHGLRRPGKVGPR